MLSKILSGMCDIGSYCSFQLWLGQLVVFLLCVQFKKWLCTICLIVVGSSDNPWKVNTLLIVMDCDCFSRMFLSIVVCWVPYLLMFCWIAVFICLFCSCFSSIVLVEDRAFCMLWSLDMQSIIESCEFQSGWEIIMLESNEVIVWFSLM